MASQSPETEVKTAPEPDTVVGEEQAETFVETALKLGGKSEEEARKTGALDRADEQVEDLFAKKYQTAGSPVHQAVWDEQVPLDLFTAPEGIPTPPEAQKVMDDSIEVVREMRDKGVLFDEERKISTEALDALGKVGYWGLLVDKEYGGTNCPFVAFAKFLTRMATVDPTVAGLASVHGCIGAVDPLRSFGDPEQKQRILTRLASGEALSAFALTEPNAGSDLTALRTKAHLDGDDYVVHGEKLFITNVVPGRTVGLVCLIDDKPAVLIADLPKEENEQFQIKKYGLWALKHTHNQGMIFNGMRVPKENLLKPTRGDGLTIAYHGLNRGRVALVANAGGTMRAMLASILPWARFRKTYGERVETRELVRRRVGLMAGMIVACDAMAEWTGWLLDEGYRGEMECTIAKVFGSEAQKEASIELMMKTHGGRSFLHGHMFGDNVHEFLAPCIYEGEGEMLSMGFFKSLIKEHGKKFFEPIGKVLAQNNIRQPNPLNPAHALKLAPVAMPYVKWRAAQTFGGSKRANVPNLPGQLGELAQFAADNLQKSRLHIDRLMQTHQLSLADRQCAMAELSQRIQDLVVMLTTALWAGRHNDELVHQAGTVMCQHLRRKYTGKRSTTAEYRTVTKLGQSIAEGNFSLLEGVESAEIMMRYEE